jgi:hypothetical protein
MGDGTAKAVGLSLAEQVEGVLMRDLPEGPDDEHGSLASPHSSFAL